MWLGAVCDPSYDPAIDAINARLDALEASRPGPNPGVGSRPAQESWNGSVVIALSPLMRCSKVVRLAATSGSTVAELKRRLAEAEGIPADQQVLVERGQYQALLEEVGGLQMYELAKADATPEARKWWLDQRQQVEMKDDQTLGQLGIQPDGVIAFTYILRGGHGC